MSMSLMLFLNVHWHYKHVIFQLLLLAHTFLWYQVSTPIWIISFEEKAVLRNHSWIEIIIFG